MTIKWACGFPAGLFLYFSHLALINTRASTLEHECHTPSHHISLELSISWYAICGTMNAPGKQDTVKAMNPINPYKKSNCICLSPSDQPLIFSFLATGRSFSFSLEKILKIFIAGSPLKYAYA